MASLPENADSATFLMVFATLVAAYDPGNSPRVAGFLDLVAEVRRALDGDRPKRETAPH